MVPSIHVSRLAVSRKPVHLTRCCTDGPKGLASDLMGLGVERDNEVTEWGDSEGRSMRKGR